MCVPIDSRGSTWPVLRLLAAIALCLAVALPYLAHPSGGVEENWFDGLRGLLFGVSIGLNLFGFRFFNRRQFRARPKL
jgi:hypothetical protein